MFNQDTPANLAAILEMNRQDEDEKAAFQDLLNNTNPEDYISRMPEIDSLPGLGLGDIEGGPYAPGGVPGVMGDPGLIDGGIDSSPLDLGDIQGGPFEVGGDEPTPMPRGGKRRRNR